MKKPKRYKKSNQNKKDKPSLTFILSITGLALFTFVIFYPSLSNGFVNWDDKVYVVDNVNIQNFDFGRFLQMFNPFPDVYLLNNYHPLTELSLAIDYQLSGLNPRGYHATNVLFHSINTALVFLLVYRMAGRKILVGTFAALLFGIHPMHVESVVWVAARKDVLYVFFYLSALLSYLRYLRTGTENRKWLILCFLLFIASLLSKAQAVTLPLVLILMDYFNDRKITKKVLLEKIPFLILSLVIGMLAIKAQAGATTMVNIPPGYRPFTASFALWVYLYKSILPIGLSALHPYPFEFGESPPWYLYASIAVMIGFLWALYYAWKRKSKIVVFGLGIFFITILPILQFLTVGSAIHAERYTYLPYLGLFFIAAYYLDDLLKSKKEGKYRIPLIAVALIFMGVCTTITLKRIPVWKSSETLWKNILHQYPKAMVGYLNLVTYYLENDAYAEAIEMGNKGLEMDPTDYKIMSNQAMAMIKNKQIPDAITTLNKALQLNDHSYIHFNLGTCFEELQRYDEAMAYYNQALFRIPNNMEALLHRGDPVWHP